MTGRTVVSTYLEDPDDYDAVYVDSHPGIVTFWLNPRTNVICLGRNADHLFETMLNRLRFEHAAQVERRGQP